MKIDILSVVSLDEKNKREQALLDAHFDCMLRIDGAVRDQIS
jgi:hypothetical protein